MTYSGASRPGPWIRAIGVLLPLVAADPVLAWQAAEPDGRRWTVPGLIGGEYDEIDIRGRLQMDVAQIGGQDKLGGPGFGTNAEARRARLGIQGDLDLFEYRIVGEFSGKDARFADAYVSIDLAGFADLTIGHQKGVASLNEQTSSRFIKFMERAAFTDAFGFSRGVGGSVDVSGANWGWSAALLSGRSLSADETFTGLVLGTRLWYQLDVEGGFVQFGASSEFRDNGGELDRLRQRPQVHATALRFINTADAVLPDGSAAGRFDATDSLYWGGEFAARLGSFDFAAELARMSIDLDGPLLPSADSSYNASGFYVQGGFFLTGEKRGWRGGKWRRTAAKRPIDRGGPGAWQINVGVDRLDLTDGGAGVPGGEQTAYLLGLDWIPTDGHIRVTVNYAHVEIDDSPGFATVDGKSDFAINWVGLRAQLDW